MKPSLILSLVLVAALSAAPVAVFAAEGVPLILSDVGPWRHLSEKRDIHTRKIAMEGGYSLREGDSGIVQSAGHYGGEHRDTTYAAYYENPSTGVKAKVQVTRHSGSGWDRWLGHEFEDGYRAGEEDEARLGVMYKGVVLQSHKGSRLVRYWNSFSWLSGPLVVSVEYSDMSRAEPIELVRAYAELLPSTLPYGEADLLSVERSRQWIRKEVQRRLELAEKHLGRLRKATVLEEAMAAQGEALDSLDTVFAYREHYFSTPSLAERTRLQGLRQEPAPAEVRKIYNAVRAWWDAHKDDKVRGF